MMSYSVLCADLRTRDNHQTDSDRTGPRQGEHQTLTCFGSLEAQSHRELSPCLEHRARYAVVRSISIQEAAKDDAGTGAKEYSIV